MKKSLNNVFKGKRLVTGDENEITQHEMLLEEKDDKVIVKQRGTDGSIQQVSGGSNNATGFNLLYYAVASVSNGSACYPYKMLKNTDFTELANIRKNVEEASDYFVNKGITGDNPYIHVEASFPSSSPIDYYTIGTREYGFTVEDEDHNIMNIQGTALGNTPSSATGIITINTFNDGILGMSGFFSNGLCTMSSNYVTTQQVKKGEGPFYFEIQNIGAYYDIKNNILYYVTASSTGVESDVRKWNIYPEKLVDTLKVYGGQTGLTYTITVNGKTFNPEQF